MGSPVSLHCFRNVAPLKETGFALHNHPLAHSQEGVARLWLQDFRLALNNATAPALKSAFAVAFALRAIKLALLAPFRYSTA